MRASPTISCPFALVRTRQYPKSEESPRKASEWKGCPNGASAKRHRSKTIRMPILTFGGTHLGPLSSSASN
eukprot:6454270-Lingulodinium_polyedra.AAC.1